MLLLLLFLLLFSPQIEAIKVIKITTFVLGFYSFSVLCLFLSFSGCIVWHLRLLPICIVYLLYSQSFTIFSRSSQSLYFFCIVVVVVGFLLFCCVQFS